jgi:hypothetical protein
MGLTGKRIIADAITVHQDQETGALSWESNYRLTGLVNGVNNGTAYVPVGEQTETEVRALVHQAIVDHANLETSNIEEFTVLDVLGGAI